MSQGIRNGALAVAVLCGMLGIGSAQAQSFKQARPGKPAATQASPGAIGMPQDWSSRSVIYHDSLRDLDEKTLVAGGTSGWELRYRDPRYLLSQMQRLQAMTLESPAEAMPVSGRATNPVSDRRRGHPTPPLPKDDTGYGSVHRDWSNVLGGGTDGLGGSGIRGVFPAKYNFDITAAPSCANDFVVYPTNAAGITGTGTTGEYWEGSFTGNPSTGTNRTVVIGSAPRTVTLTSTTDDNTGLNFIGNANGITNDIRATNLRNAINRWSSQTGFTASGSGATVRVTSNTLGDISNTSVSETLDNSFNFTRTGATGTPSQPTIIAFNQLYQGTCNGAWNQNGATKAPNTMWAYNTGTGYVVETSPVLSYEDDGKQVAFIQRNGNTLQLVLLKWAGGQGAAGAPATPGIIATDGAGYAAERTNAGSVMYVMTLDGTSNVGGTPTYSSPYVDYATDTLWVGDGNGRLHKFTGVFKGTPAEVLGGGFPATVETGMKLSPPVEYAGNVYVGSQSGGAGIGGKLHRVNAATGQVFSSSKLANNSSTGILDGLIIDSATNSVFAFLFNDGSAGNNTDCAQDVNNNDACRVIARFATGFAAGANPLQRVYVGRGNNFNSILHGGGFDDAYYSSGTGTGAMYIVGGTPADTFIPTLWKVPFVNGVAQAPQIGPAVGTKPCDTLGQGCLTEIFDWSPVTTIKNGGNEYLYFGMNRDGAAAGCTGACIYMLQLNDLDGDGTPNEPGDTTWGPGNVARAALAAPGGTSGIVVDNTSATTGTSQIYFTQLQSGGNAIQASQSGLQ